MDKEGFGGEVKFTPKTLLFIAEYQVDRNGKEAAIRAGFSPRTAAVAASRLLANHNVRRAIDMALEEKLTEIGVTRDNVLREVGRLAFGNIQNLYDDAGNLREIKDLPSFVAATVQSIEYEAITTKDGDKLGMVTKVKMADKTQNLKLLMQHFNLLDPKPGRERPMLGSTDEEVQAELTAVLKELGFVRLEGVQTGRIIEAETVTVPV